MSWWDGIMLKHPWVAGLAFDPQVPGRVWLTDWYGTWRTDDINAATVNWTNYVQGHEEVVVFSMISPREYSYWLAALQMWTGLSTIAV
uniref:Uncharacterized protein n=1 Tax=Desertifilum tharense IPPAS B-1220 TaxID=1781255 RepID=A0ACD5GWC5_9CYAN